MSVSLFLLVFCATGQAQSTHLEPAVEDSAVRSDQTPPPLELSPTDADANTKTIEAIVQAGGQAVIPRGSWPVRPIQMGTGSRLTGLGRGVSELRLEIARPGRFDPQHVIATVVQDDPRQFTTDVHIRRLTVHATKMKDLDGPQILAIRDVKDISVHNVSAWNLHPSHGGVGVLFRNTTGQVTRLAIGDLRNTNYPLRIDGNSDLRLTNVTLQETQRGAIQVGDEPSRPHQPTIVQLTDFRFFQTGLVKSDLPLARVVSSRQVVFGRGTIKDPGQSTFTVQLHSDVRFDNCRFERSRFGLFDPATAGVATGMGNNW